SLNPEILGSQIRNEHTLAICVDSRTGEPYAMRVKWSLKSAKARGTARQYCRISGFRMAVYSYWLSFRGRIGSIFPRHRGDEAMLAPDLARDRRKPRSECSPHIGSFRRRPDALVAQGDDLLGVEP